MSRFMMLIRYYSTKDHYIHYIQKQIINEQKVVPQKSSLSCQSSHKVKKDTRVYLIAIIELLNTNKNKSKK